MKLTVKEFILKLQEEGLAFLDKAYALCITADGVYVANVGEDSQEAPLPSEDVLCVYNKGKGAGWAILTDGGAEGLESQNFFGDVLKALPEVDSFTAMRFAMPTCDSVTLKTYTTNGARETDLPESVQGFNNTVLFDNNDNTMLCGYGENHVPFCVSLEPPPAESAELTTNDEPGAGNEQAAAQANP